MLTYDHHQPLSTAKPTVTDKKTPSTASMSLPEENIINNDTGSQPKTRHHHIWLVTGPAGCGKSTVAQYIASTMKLPFIEGDDFHPASNVEKMAHGEPLTDSDRWDWLTVLREEALRQLGSGSQGVVMACSALKKKYRDVIRVAPYHMHDALVHFVYLHADETVLMQRVAARKGHYMAADMVHSQFSILEEPSEDEGDCLTIDVGGTVDEVEREALALVERVVQAELAGDSRRP